MNYFGHYTSINGLKGILESKSLWATNIKYLNDHEEFDHTLMIIERIVSDSLKKRNVEKPDIEYFETFSRLILKEVKTLNERYCSNLFVVSFTSELDQLSQWRGYCAANNGVCIAFNLDDIKQKIDRNYSNVSVVDCIYTDKIKNSMIADTLYDGWKLFRSNLLNEGQNYLDDNKILLERVVEELSRYACYFKNEKFSEEKEKRILIDFNANEYDNFEIEDLRFRAGTYSLIPFIEIEINISSISEIVVGPTRDINLSKNSTELFIRKVFESNNSSQFPIVSQSKVPYRVV